MASHSRIFFQKFSKFFTFLFLFLSSPILALDCKNCGEKDIPTLLFACPKCGGQLHSVESRVQARSTATLVIELFYTGERPDDLPEYGKLFINRKFRGNIPLVEREKKDPIRIENDKKGLGVDFTGVYRIEKRNMDIGLHEIQVEMMFKRLSGIWKSHRRVVFKNVVLKSGEKTTIRHFFSGPKNFSKKKPPEKAVPNPDRPIVQGASGTLALEFPIFN